jgi:(E)-4-hydroxy-3-methylbut-2-enyl-diphosphate synthase
MGLRERRNVDLIACPSCGRAEIDVIKVASDALAAFGEREIPLQVAVMGCVVNGPGEARDADLGIAAGRRKGHLFVRGRNVAVVAEDEMVPELVRWAELIMEEGVDAALARADPRAESAAETDRQALLAVQGDDVNRTGVKVDLVRRAAGTPG